MPRYFFHSEDGGPVRDLDGANLTNATAARREAIRLGGSLIADNPELLDDDEFRVFVTDAAGARVMTLNMQVDGSDQLATGRGAQEPRSRT